jgi:hypothetical protein
MNRPTNEDVCQGFRELLTTGFYLEQNNTISNDLALTLTRPWRGDLWRAFKEIEVRLCPTKAGGPR